MKEVRRQRRDVNTMKLLQILDKNMVGVWKQGGRRHKNEVDPQERAKNS